MLKNTIMYLLPIMGLVSVFYYSWKPLPDIETAWYMPHWLTEWAIKNYNLRTTLPFLLIGGALGEAVGKWKTSGFFTPGQCFLLSLVRK